uniref:Uncharacterized protein n=1 Tax=Romanomermis culicivorax TaxID=13658 RepID=A0A915K4X8_ROMCU
MDIQMCKEISANDTLIVPVVVEDYALDNVFTERGFHCND